MDIDFVGLVEAVPSVASARPNNAVIPLQRFRMRTTFCGGAFPLFRVTRF